MRRTLEAVQEHVAAIHEFHPELKAIATSALRRAGNAEEFARAVEDLAGVPLEIITGEEEARYSYEGAISGLPVEQTYGVLDVGGGSSEYATRDASVSFEMGAVRLTERFPSLREVATAGDMKQARAEAQIMLRPLHDFAKIDCLVMVGGSATTSRAVVAGRRMTEPYEALARAELASVIERLSLLTVEQRKDLSGMVAQRADILLSGALILDEAYILVGHSQALVTTNDLLLGYLLRH